VAEKLFKDPLAWLDDAPDKAPKWKNLAFTKDGRSYLGRLTYDSQEAALQGHLACQQQLKDSLSKERHPYIRTMAGVDIQYPSEYSHSIQVPILK
jgi:hypothetical protein